MNNKLMRSKKFIFSLVVVTIIVITGFVIIKFYNNDCVGCGGCSYEPFTEKVYVSSYEFDNSDSLMQVNFTIKGQKTNDLMWIDGYDLSDIGFNFWDKETLNDTALCYMISGEKISHGSCKPYQIERISIEK